MTRTWYRDRAEEWGQRVVAAVAQGEDDLEIRNPDEYRNAASWAAHFAIIYLNLRAAADTGKL